MATDEGILVTKFKNFCDMPGHSEPAQLVHFVTNCISSFIDADPTDPVGEAGAFLAADAFLDLQRAIDPGTEPTAYAGRPVPILAAEPSARAQIVFKEEKILHSRQIRVLPALQRALHNALPPPFPISFSLAIRHRAPWLPPRAVGKAADPTRPHHSGAYIARTRSAGDVLSSGRHARRILPYP